MYKLTKEKANKIWDMIGNAHNIVLCTHIDPDGDTIGASIALKNLIKIHYPDIDIKISGDKYPRYLNFLEKNDVVDDVFFNDATVIVVDTSTPSRIFDKRVITDESIKIDHHHPEANWLIEIGGDEWPATGQIIYEFAKLLNLEMNQKVLEGIFVAIWTDTEGLSQRNITSATYEAIEFIGEKISEELLKKMELTSTEKKHINYLQENNFIFVDESFAFLITDDVVPNDYIRQMTGMLSKNKKYEVYCGITKVDDNNYRGELRSKGNVDVSVLARMFSGGGHHSSAGFKVKSIAEAYKCIEIIKKELASTNS